MEINARSLMRCRSFILSDMHDELDLGLLGASRTDSMFRVKLVSGVIFYCDSVRSVFLGARFSLSLMSDSTFSCTWSRVPNVRGCRYFLRNFA